MMQNINQMLQEWKKRLGLDDWSIKIIPNCKPEDMSIENVSGCTEWEESIKSARIELLDPQFYGERIVQLDLEKTLVHELLHLKLSLVSSDVDDLQLRYMHQIIDDLARAFVDAKRKKGDEHDQP